MKCSVKLWCRELSILFVLTMNCYVHGLNRCLPCFSHPVVLSVLLSLNPKFKRGTVCEAAVKADSNHSHIAALTLQCKQFISVNSFLRSFLSALSVMFLSISLHPVKGFLFVFHHLSCWNALPSFLNVESLWESLTLCVCLVSFRIKSWTGRAVVQSALKVSESFSTLRLPLSQNSLSFK